MGFVSSRASVHHTARLAASAVVLGPSVIGPRAIIGDSVTIGHPSPQEFRSIMESWRNSMGYYELMDEVVHEQTEIGECSIVRSGTTIYSGSRTASQLDCGHGTLIRENCSIGQDVMIVPGTHVMADVVIGHGARIAGTLCNRTVVGNCASFLGHAVHKFAVGVPGHVEPSPSVGAGALVGREACVIGDVSLADLSVVGAGAVVTRSTKYATIWVGNPARKVASRDLNECADLLRRMDKYAEFRST